MSPEIMDNKRYNSKTDIWSLGCILYEIMCLQLPFEGNSMQELSKNIQTGNGGVVCSSLHFSQPLQELVRDMLLRNSTLRPGINAILSRPVVKACISTFLDASVKCKEFSHTVIHGMNILSVEPTVEKVSGLSGRRNTESSDEAKRGSGKGIDEKVFERGDSRERGLREQEKQEVQKMMKKREGANSPVAPPDRRFPLAVNVDQTGIRSKQPIQQESRQRGPRKEVHLKVENDEAESRQALERKRAYEKEAVRLLRRANEAVNGEEKDCQKSPVREERAEYHMKEKGKERGRNILARENLFSYDVPAVDEQISATVSDAEETRKLAAQKDLKAKQNLLRFEKERMDRQKKFVKKADAYANARMAWQREQDMMYQLAPRAPQHSPSPCPSPSLSPFPSPSLSPTPPVPRIEITNGCRAELKVQELPRKVSHVSPVHAPHKPSMAVADVEVKSSSVQTADILQTNISRKSAHNQEERHPDQDRVENLVWKEEYRGIAGNHHVHRKQSTVCENEASETEESHAVVVSPFIFSGNATPWCPEDPSKAKGKGNNLKGEIPSDACVAAAVEYSELFAQMQDILEHSSAPRPKGTKVSNKGQIHQADQGMVHHQIDDCDGAESDATFGDEDKSG